MEVHKEFLQILEERGLIQIGDISDLSGNLGIDGDFWLESLTPIDAGSELMGSLTMSMRPNILKSLESIRSSIKSAVIVFPGIPLSEKSCIPYFTHWEQVAKRSENLKNIELKPTKHIDNFYTIFEIIKYGKGEVLRAPYFSAAQILSLVEAGLVQNVLGMSDLVFYGIPNIIIELMQTKYKYINSAEILNQLGLSANELRQMFVMKGYFSKVLSDLPMVVLVDTLKYVRAENLASDPLMLNEITEVLDCKVSLGIDTAVLHYTRSEYMKNYGVRLPKEIYFAMSYLNLSPWLLHIVAHNKFIESRPVADSNNYRRMLRCLKDSKSSVLSILEGSLNKAYFQSPIRIQYWYSEIHDEVKAKPLAFLKWKITPLTLSSALSAQKKNFPDLQFCLKWHLDDFNSKKDLIITTDHPTVYSPACLQAKIYFQFLESIGYIFPSGIPSLFGKSLTSIDPEWQSSTIYLQELLKFGLLNGRTLSQNQCNSLSTEAFEKLCGISTDDNSRHAIMLISRVFSLVQPTLNEEPWTGEVDYDLAQFHSIVNLIFISYQRLFEAIVLREMMSQTEFSKEIVGVCRKSPMEPFPHPAVGIAIKRLLIYDDINRVAEELPQMADLFLDLHRGWMFWKNFVKLMNIFKQHNSVPDNSFMNEITYASKKLKNALLRARIQVSN